VAGAPDHALARDELRGRYNAMSSMVFGVGGVVGPVAAGPLIGGGRAATWAVLVVSGCLVASLLALSLHRRLTPAQDGRVGQARATRPVRIGDEAVALDAT